MKRIILFISLVCSFVLEINSLVSAEISATIISRRSDPQITRLESWLKQRIPGIKVKDLDFKNKETRRVLSKLKIEFIPAVIFAGPLSQSEIRLLKEKFKVFPSGDFLVIPRGVLQRGAILELYRRRRRPDQLELFVMSLCPYALGAERRLLKNLRVNTSDIDLKLHYIVGIEGNKFTSLRGERELKEDRRQLIIQKYWPRKFPDYLLLRQKEYYLKTVRKLSLRPEEIEKRLSESEPLLLNDYKLSKELEISASPTFLWENKYIVSSLGQLSRIPAFNQKPNVRKSAYEAKGPLKILFFHSPRCHACREVKNTILPGIIARYKNKIEIVYYNVDSPDNFSRLLEMEDKFGSLESGSIPKMFIGKTVLTGSTQIRDELEKIIVAYIAKGKRNFPGRPASESKAFPERILSLFKTFSAGAVCWAGLTDGINPCAFTTLIFFLSFLSFAGYRRREIFYLGAFFILSSFLTYFLLGLGLLKFILRLKIYSLIADVFYYAVGGLVFLLGVISLYDFYRYKKTGKSEDIKLKLPQSVKKRIQAIIGRGYRKDKRETGMSEAGSSPLKLILLALLTGFIVSILESVCTGQVYLPTITFITRVPELKMQAIFYLLLYNLMFIIPLIVIFILSICGLTSERFAQFSRRHLAKIKLATALFFFSLFFLLWKLK